MKIRLTHALRNITAIILATILIFQISTFSQFGITGRNNNSDIMVQADHGLQPVPHWINPNTCELSKDVTEAYKAGFTLGKSSKVYSPPEVPKQFSDTPQEMLQFNGGYLDALHCVPSTPKGGSPTGGGTQTACPTTPESGIVRSSFSSSRHNNSIQHMNYHSAVAAEEDRSAATLSNYGNEVEKRHTNEIITVADTKSMETTSGPLNSHKFDKWPWKFTYEIVDKQGLVIKGLWAEPRQPDIPEQEILRSLAVPHFEITFLDCKPRIFRFDIGEEDTKGLSPATEFSTGKYAIKWGFKEAFNDEQIKGTLSINYDIVINTLPRNNCEKGAGLNCYRFIPKVSYSWSGSPRDVLYFTAFYRLDYGPNAGFALTKDADDPRKFAKDTVNRQDIRDKEIRFIAVEAGEPKGGWYDNIHTVHKDQNVIIPGCARGSFLWGLGGLFSGTAALFKGTPLSRLTNVYYPFDCVHMHWRWSANTIPEVVDPMVDPSDDQHVSSKLPAGFAGYQPGTPNLVLGQTIEIGVLRVDDKKLVEANDPDDPLSLIDNKKPKQIATTYENDPYVLSKGWGRKTLKNLNDQTGKPVSTVVWYVATREKANSDTFFRHGIFIIDPPGGGSLWQNVKTLLSSSDPKVQPYLNDVLQKENWSTDGNMLVAHNGERVFNDLSQLAASALEVKSKTPGASGSADAALTQLLFTVQIIVNNDLLSRVSNTFNLNPTKQTELISLLSRNELVKQSSEKFRATSNEIDVSKALQIIGGFKETWINGVQGINQVTTELGTIPTPPQADATTAATTKSKFTDYFNTALKMSMKYPLDWTKTETANSVVLTSKHERLDIFYHQNIPLFPTAVETLEKNVQKAIDDQTPNNMEIKDSKDITVSGGLPAKRVVYTFTTTTTQHVDEYSVMAIIVVNKNDLYKIFFTAKSNQFDSQLPLAERIIDSIRFTQSAGNIPKTSTTTTTTTTPSAASVKLLPGSSPHFFKCKETPTEGLPTLPGLDIESSANTAITDGDPNTEMLGKAIFDISFDKPIENNAGPDLIVYELGSTFESFSVASVYNNGSISAFKEYDGSTSTGSTDNCGFGIFSTQIDLRDFGIGDEDGDTISTIRIDNKGAPGCCTGADISDVLVINEAPSSGAPTITTPLSPITTTGQQQSSVTTTPVQSSSPQLGTENKTLLLLLSDDFNSENGGHGSFNWANFRNWNVKNGSMDLVGIGSIGGVYDVPGGDGLYVELDGSANDAGILESRTEFTFEPGEYILEFDLSGFLISSSSNVDAVTVRLGDAFTETFTMKKGSYFEHITKNISVPRSTIAKLSFDHTGGDNNGLLLDNVKLYKSTDTSTS